LDNFSFECVSYGLTYIFIQAPAGKKTVNALGLALRSVGHHHTVVIIQFLKWWKNTGEYKMRRFSNPTMKSTSSDVRGGTDYEIWTRDRKLAKEGLAFAKGIVEEKKHIYLS